jgi:ABC-type polysaccharide/polyol phosphate export permease
VGYWTSLNYGLFIIIGFQIGLLKNVVDGIPSVFAREKGSRNLANMMIAPINHLTLLFGIMLSRLVFISIPFCAFLIAAWFLYPCSAITLAAVGLTFFAVSIIFMEFGTILGVFAMSSESVWKVLDIGVYFLFWLSAVNYPVEIFPVIVQSVIKLNPLYYFFDLIRYIWIENNILLTISAHWLDVLLLAIFTVILPFLAYGFFEKIFQKYGIVL